MDEFIISHNGAKFLLKLQLSFQNTICVFNFRDHDHPFQTSACLRGGGVYPCADGQKVTVHKDQKSPPLTSCWNADGSGVGVKNRKNLPTS